MKDKCFEIKVAVTPSLELIGKSLDPTGNYPRSLSEFANDTNPVVLQFIDQAWANRPINIVTADFYHRTDLVKLCQNLNGIPVDLSNNSMRTDTRWGQYKLGYEEARDQFKRLGRDFENLGRDIENFGEDVGNFFKGLGR